MIWVGEIHTALVQCPKSYTKNPKPVSNLMYLRFKNGLQSQFYEICILKLNVTITKANLCEKTLGKD